MATKITERLDIVLADRRVIRLAGLDMPLAGEGQAGTTDAAQAFLANALVGQDSTLVVFAPKPDRWGRWLGDLMLGEQSAAEMVLRAGFARVRPEFETRGCAAQRLENESAARAAALGLWTDPAYRVIDAADWADLRRHDGQFAIIEGVVLKVGQGASRLYLDFARRGGFTAVALRSKASEFDKAGVDLAGLAGKRVRLRGAVDDRFGLRIELLDPRQIQRVEEGAGGMQEKQ